MISQHNCEMKLLKNKINWHEDKGQRTQISSTNEEMHAKENKYGVFENKKGWGETYCHFQLILLSFFILNSSFVLLIFF